MRLNATADDDGWLNRTLSFAATSNVFQFRCRLLDAWSICVWPAPGVEIVPCPSTTTPPVGPARAGESAPQLSEAAKVNATGPCACVRCGRLGRRSFLQAE